jgi:hypothetical protein
VLRKKCFNIDKRGGGGMDNGVFKVVLTKIVLEIFEDFFRKKINTVSNAMLVPGQKSPIVRNSDKIKASLM